MSRRGWLLFAAVSVLWGIPYLLIKVAVEDLHPTVIVFARTALAAVLLLPIAALRGQLGALRGHWRLIPVFAVVEIAVPFTLISTAETRLSSSLTGLIIAMVPLLAAVGARVMGLDDRIGPTRVAGLLLGLAGVALLVGVDLRGAQLLAALAVTGAAIGYVIGPLILDTRLSHLPGTALIAVSLAVSAVLLAPFAVVNRPTGPVSQQAWGAVAVLGVVATAVALLAFSALIAEVGTSRASVITFVNPIIALALGVGLLDEQVTAGMLIGFPLVIVGSVLATRRGRRLPASRPPQDDVTAPGVVPGAVRG